MDVELELDTVEVEPLDKAAEPITAELDDKLLGFVDVALAVAAVVNFTSGL